MSKLQVVVAEEVKRDYQALATDMNMSLSAMLRAFLGHSGYVGELVNVIDIIKSEAKHGEVACSIFGEDFDWREYAHEQLDGLIDEAIKVA